MAQLKEQITALGVHFKSGAKGGTKGGGTKEVLVDRVLALHAAVQSSIAVDESAEDSDFEKGTFKRRRSVRQSLPEASSCPVRASPLEKSTTAATLAATDSPPERADTTLADVACKTVNPVAATADDSETSGAPMDLWKQTVAQLKERLAARGLSTAGTKAVLIDRLNDSDADDADNDADNDNNDGDEESHNDASHVKSVGKSAPVSKKKSASAKSSVAKHFAATKGAKAGKTTRGKREHTTPPPVHRRHRTTAPPTGSSSDDDAEESPHETAGTPTLVRTPRSSKAKATEAMRQAARQSVCDAESDSEYGADAAAASSTDDDVSDADASSGDSDTSDDEFMPSLPTQRRRSSGASATPAHVAAPHGASKRTDSASAASSGKSTQRSAGKTTVKGKSKGMGKASGGGKTVDDEKAGGKTSKSKKGKASKGGKRSGPRFVSGGSTAVKKRLAGLAHANEGVWGGVQFVCCVSGVCV